MPRLILPRVFAAQGSLLPIPRQEDRVSLREGRRWLTGHARSAGLAAAPFLSPGAIDVLERWLGRAGPWLPMLGAQVARNMRAAGVFSESAFREYFRQVALHLTNGMRLFRDQDDNRSVSTVTARADEQIVINASISHLREALNAGRGAVVATPHVCNYLLTAVRLSREVPMRIYLRWSHDERKRQLKEAWCRAAGLDVVLEPASATDPTSRASALVDILRAGHALVITPDIAQRRGKGIAVRMCGRVVYLPSGPASVAMLAEAPLVPLVGRIDGRKHTMMFHEPISVTPLTRAEGGRPAALARAMQRWTDHFERFIREFPAAWFLWGDGRWTRVFSGDPRYNGAGISTTTDAMADTLGAIEGSV